mmetsp:Transcript_55536/g.99939  ORF Transcript_55536/g.99939 Transcript_55536/m.99939 type:complete len:82 (-) Transcript_55536:95-340(-)
MASKAHSFRTLLQATGRALASQGPEASTRGLECACNIPAQAEECDGPREQHWKQHSSPRAKAGTTGTNHDLLLKRNPEKYF